MRLFIGIPIPKELAEILSLIKYNVHGNINWVPQKNFHITLKFLGEITEKKVEKIILMLKEIKFNKFFIENGTYGFFPNKKYVKVFWMGVTPSESVFELHKLIEIRLSKFFKMEQDYIPHITLGRVKYADFSDINKVEIQKIKFEVNCFKLYQSTLTDIGPIYSVIENFKFD